MTDTNDKTNIQTPVTPSAPKADDKKQDAVMERLDQIENGLKVELEESRKEVAEMKKNISNLSHSDNQDEIVDTARKSAHTISLTVIGGAPIVKSSISSVLGIEGLELMAEVKNARGDKYTVPFGCDIKKLDFSKENLEGVYKTSFESLNTEKFKLVNIDQNDLTGASKVEYKKVISEGQPVNEIDRSTGTPRATGKKVRAVVMRDVREYTIEFEGKKFKLTEDDLANIRK